MCIRDRQEHRVAWDASVVDNEHLGRRKSKRCCIFHKQRPFDESSSESEDEDEGGWEMGPDGKPVWVPNESGRGHAHSHSHSHGHGHGHAYGQNGCGGGGDGHS